MRNILYYWMNDLAKEGLYIKLIIYEELYIMNYIIRVILIYRI